MTEPLKQALRRVRAPPSDSQDGLARLLPSVEDEADLMQAEAEITRGEFATDAEVEATFSRYRL